MKSPYFSESLSKKLLLYSLGVGAASAATTSQAAVVTTVVGVNNANFQFNLQNTVPYSTANANNNGTTFANGQQFAILSAGGNGCASRNTDAGASGNYLTETVARVNGNAVTRNYILALSAGTTIGASTNGSTTTRGETVNFNQGVGADSGNGRNYFNDFSGEMGLVPAGDWAVGTRAFVGFEILDLTGSFPMFFGFADVTQTNNNNPTAGPAAFTLNGYAYNNTQGASITTFAIPEPASSTALLVAGAAGVAAMRRRRLTKAPKPLRE